MSWAYVARHWSSLGVRTRSSMSRNHSRFGETSGTNPPRHAILKRNQAASMSLATMASTIAAASKSRSP
jgi:hypothetical protein